jgi:kumamolisin
MPVDVHEWPESVVPHQESTRRSRDADPGEQLEVSVYLKPRSQKSGELPRRETREQMRERRTVEHADDIREVTAFATEHGLRVVSVEPGRRRLRLAGSAGQFGAAFHTSLGMYEAEGREFRSYSGPLSLPVNLSDKVEAVLGLDTRPMPRPRLIPASQSADVVEHLPSAMAGYYNFPAYATGAGQTIAIIELSGGYFQQDLVDAFKAMGLPVPSVTWKSVVDEHGQNEGTNSPGTGGNDLEVAGDIQMAGALANGANLVVYFGNAAGNDGNFGGYIDALTMAINDEETKPGVISSSWVAVENAWLQSDRDTLFSTLIDASGLGISVFFAAGDLLATCGETDGNAYVYAPASCSWAIGCGGTTLETSGSSVLNEVVWNGGTNGTGGGISEAYGEPGYQQNTNLPPSVNGTPGGFRGLPDVAANADPSSGYQIFYAGVARQVGGTSLAAPLWAALAARLNQLYPPGPVGEPQTIGMFLPTLYQYPSVMRDITSGNNAPTAYPALGYQAGPGWDACTGLGTPDGGSLAILLTRYATSPSITATGWFDTSPHLRVYTLWPQGIAEYAADGSWSLGVTIGVQTSAASKLATVAWSDAIGEHGRLYYQDSENAIRECRHENGMWIVGRSLATAAAGSNLAALQWVDSTGTQHIRVYYQDAQNVIQEYKIDNARYAPGATLPAAAPGTGLAACLWQDQSAHLRLYYQDTGNVIREQCNDNGNWSGGGTLPTAVPGSSLAAGVWIEDGEPEIRVYYQDAQDVIQEYVFDVGEWETGRTLPVGAAGTGLAVHVWTDTAGAHIRLYYQDSESGTNREYVLDSRQWAFGQFVLQT